MLRARLFTVLLVITIFAATRSAAADTVTINFDDLSDSTFVTTQYTGVTFSNAIVLSAGISLNELDFPPNSGTNVAGDTGGAISILFSNPISNFSGYFTYVEPLTIQGFNSSSVLEASAASLFSENDVSGGDPGSSPNELIQIISATPFSRVVLTGDPAGGSFTVDDVSYTLAAGVPVSSVPEPSTLAFVSTGVTSIIGVAGAKRKRGMNSIV
jgi:hypothetical protein